MPTSLMATRPNSMRAGTRMFLASGAALSLDRDPAQGPHRRWKFQPRSTLRDFSGAPMRKDAPQDAPKQRGLGGSVHAARASTA